MVGASGEPSTTDVPAGTSSGRVPGWNVFRLPAAIEQIPCRSQRLHDDRADLRLQPPPNHHHAVGVLIDVQRPMPPARRLLRLGLPVHAPPAADDELDVLRRARPAHREQPLFGFWRRDPGQRADLGVRQLTTRERL
jgi:hypothetical protein